MIETLPLDLLYPVAAIAGTAILSALAGRAWGRRTIAAAHATERPCNRRRRSFRRELNTGIAGSSLLFNDQGGCINACGQSQGGACQCSNSTWRRQACLEPLSEGLIGPGIAAASSSLPLAAHSSQINSGRVAKP